MTKYKRNINNIIHDRLIGNISFEDQERLRNWLEASQENKARYQSFIKEARLLERYNEYAKVDEVQGWKKFRKKHLSSKSICRKTLLPYAAILMIPLIGAAIWLWTLNGVNSETGLTREVRVVMARSEQAGKKKATLILPSGQKVDLRSMPKQALPQSASPPIQPADTLSGIASVLNNNRLTTREDSEYWMVFDDGTTVHLNYNTTLMYPSRFSSVSRTVYLDGEAYFQVAKDSKRPFRVVTRDGIVKEYGTSFNVNTYAGCTKVVLVEGSVSVIPNDGEEQKVSPGELAVLHPETPEVQVSKTDIEPYVAWNSGRFVFNHCSLENLMEVIARWYNREVVFESEEIKRMRFTGDVDRYGSVVPIIKAIQRVTGLDIVVGEKIIVLKKKQY